MHPNNPDLCKRCGKLHPGLCQVLHLRRVPPKDGEPHTKRANDKVYNWCVKCNMWIVTHITEMHVSRADTKKQSEAATNLATDGMAQGSTAGSTTTDASYLGSSINYASYSLAALSTS